VEGAYGARVESLPMPARRLLALVAAEDSGRLIAIAPAAEELGLTLGDLEPSERAGLASISYGVLQWRHPLVRAAAYRAVSPDERRAMHAALARAVLPAHDDARAWHLAAAALGPDEEVAAALDEAARRARARSAYSAAATASE